MALKFIDNFFPYGTVGSTLANANANFNTQWITQGSAAAVITTGFQARGNALLLPRTGSTYAQVERRFTSTEDVVVIGYAFRATQRNAVTFSIRADPGTPIVELGWPGDMTINGVGPVSPITILLNKTYFVEIKLTKSTKEAVLKINGFDYLTTTFSETVPDTIQCYWGFPAAATPAADFVFSNVYFADGEVGKFTGFVNPQRVVTRLVTSAVEPGWTPEPSGKSRVDIMNNIPANAAEYTEADTVGDEDMYNSSETIDPAAVINAVAITSLLTKTDIDDQYVATKISDGVTDRVGADIAVPIQPAYFQTVFETDAEEQNWSPSTAESTSYGLVVRPRP